MPDFVGTILMLVFWIFIVNGIFKFFKRAAAAGKVNTDPKQQTKPKSTSQTFQEIFKELQKKAEEAKAKQNMPPYAKPVAKPVVIEQKKVIQQAQVKPLHQTIYKHKEGISEKAKKSDLEFDRFVQKERTMRHDVEQSELFRKIYEIKPAGEEDENVVPFELDLKNAIIGALILERPYS